MKVAEHVHSSTDGHLGRFHAGAIINRAAMRILAHVFVCVCACVCVAVGVDVVFAEYMYALLVTIYLKVELLAHGVCICLVSKLANKPYILKNF